MTHGTTPRPAAAELATVHGAPVRPSDPVWVDAHTHAWVDPAPGVRAPDEVALRDEELRTTALADFARHAGPRRAVAIDCQPPGAGRDARVLARLARTSGVALAATTGFHLARYYPGERRPWPDAEAAHAAFVADLDVGLAELPDRRAAVIKAADTGAAASGREGPDAPWWAAAIAARAAADALLLIHTERGADTEGLLGWLLDRGVPASRVYLCHVDKRADLGLHQELAGAGALLGYDTFLRPKYDPDRTTWPLVRQMLDAGLAHAVAFGLDQAQPATWPSRDPTDDAATALGPAGLLTVVAPRLRALGASEAEVDALLGRNLVERAARPSPTPHSYRSRP